jgi:hypothetical protein
MGHMNDAQTALRPQIPDRDPSKRSPNNIGAARCNAMKPCPQQHGAARATFFSLDIGTPSDRK